MVNKICCILAFLCAAISTAQNDSIPVATNDVILIANDTIQTITDPNKPARAAFYSAVLPGLGQVYNRKYWKLPIVYGALGGGVYVYLQNADTYNRLRTAYKIRIAGGTNDEFSTADGTPFISTLGLERAQKVSQRNKELSILVTAAFYVLQIIDANVDGHLSQFNVDRNLSVLPYLDYNQTNNGLASGFALTYTF